MTAPDPQFDPRLLRALGDPARQQVLTVINERAATAAEIATATGIAAEAVRDHLIALEANDAAERLLSVGDDEGEPAYRARIRPFLDDVHWQELPVERRRELFAQNLDQITERLQLAVRDGAFDDIRSHVSLTRVELDDEGWQEVADLLAGVLDEIMDIHAESIDRARKGASPALTGAELVILHFRPGDRTTRR